MKVSELREGLRFFSSEARLTLDYVPATFESSAPKNPSILYILVDELPKLLHDDDEKTLMEMGWHREDDGEVWTLTNH